MWSKAKSAKCKRPKMHIEIQVALNFVISYLYNKLPRRRVNIFGEELEKALKQKFHGHWYPQTPFKVSIDFFSFLFYILSAILPTSLISSSLRREEKWSMSVYCRRMKNEPIKGNKNRISSRIWLFSLDLRQWRISIVSLCTYCWGRKS